MAFDNIHAVFSQSMYQDFIPGMGAIVGAEIADRHRSPFALRFTAVSSIQPQFPNAYEAAITGKSM